MPECFGWLLLLEVNDTKPLNSFKSLFSMISVLALGCLCFVSPTAVCFFTLLFAAQKPLLLLLIGLKENAVPLETYGHSRENKIEKKREKKPGTNWRAPGRSEHRSKSPLQSGCCLGFSHPRCCPSPLLVLCMDLIPCSVSGGK